MTPHSPQNQLYLDNIALIKEKALPTHPCALKPTRLPKKISPGSRR
jgi:hypothetical protein